MNISEYWDPAFALSTQDILNGPLPLFIIMKTLNCFPHELINIVAVNP